MNVNDPCVDRRAEDAVAATTDALCNWCDRQITSGSRLCSVRVRFLRSNENTSHRAVNDRATITSVNCIDFQTH